MKTLYLMRHAKSSWDDPRAHDFNRALNDRGKHAAPLVAEFMRKKRLHPRVIVCSPAARTREPAALVVDAAHLRGSLLRYDERIYDAILPTLLMVVSEIEPDAQSALLIGHNPGTAELIRFLTGEKLHVPTAALAKVALDVEAWRDACEGCGRLEFFITPKELEDTTA